MAARLYQGDLLEGLSAAGAALRGVATSAERAAAPRAGRRRAREAPRPSAGLRVRLDRGRTDCAAARGARSAAGAGAPDVDAPLPTQLGRRGAALRQYQLCVGALAARAARGARRSTRGRYTGRCCSGEPAHSSVASPSAAGSGHRRRRRWPEALLHVGRAGELRLPRGAARSSWRSSAMRCKLSLAEHRGTPGRGDWARPGIGKSRLDRRAGRRRPGARERAPCIGRCHETRAGASRSDRGSMSLRAGRLADRRPRPARDRLGRGLARRAGPAASRDRSRHAGRPPPTSDAAQLFEADGAARGAHWRVVSARGARSSRTCTGPTR